jgi:hypothetical protein
MMLNKRQNDPIKNLLSSSGRIEHFSQFVNSAISVNFCGQWLHVQVHAANIHDSVAWVDDI